MAWESAAGDTLIIAVTTNPPQSHLWRARRYSSWQRMDSHISCATSCAMPTADESNQPWVRYIHTAVPYASYVKLTLCCLISLSPPKKRILPFPTGDLNSQSFHWNNGKI